MPFEKLVCVACGAPIDRQLEQDSVVCPFCSTRNHFKAETVSVDPRVLDLLTKMDGKLDGLHKPTAKVAAPRTAVPPAPQIKPPAGNAEFVEYIRQMARSGKKIEAIKLVRERFNSGLAEAKNYVESL